MIELYKLHWSHYVEKVVLALEFKNIPWRGIDINAFSKKEMRHLAARQYVPLIHDTQHGIALSDSSKILGYLDERYPQSPRLFSSDAATSRHIHSWILAMDSYLGLPARRIAYAQVLREKPTLMADLFLPQLWGGVLNWPGIRSLSSAVVGMMLTTRFRLHRNVDDGVFRQLESFLFKVVEQLGQRRYLFEDRITAADLTLASLMRPLRVSNYFKDHPILIPIFRHQERIFAQFKRPLYLYEERLLAQRLKKIPAKYPALERRTKPLSTAKFSLDLLEAINDQQPVYHWKFLLSPWHYFRLRYGR